MNRLARLSAAERGRIIEEFVTETFDGLDAADPDMRHRMRHVPELPDGDGFITAAEYKSAMAQMGDFHVTESVAEAVIAAQDTDEDKLLSFDEFWAHLNK